MADKPTDDLVKALRSVHEESQKTEKAFGSIVFSAEKLAKILDTKLGHALGTSIGIKEQYQQAARAMIDGLTGSNVMLDGINKKISEARGQGKRAKGNPAVKEAYDSYIMSLEAQVSAVKAMQATVDLQMKKLPYAPLLVALYADVARKSHEINDALINTNGALTYRLKLMESIAHSQFATGASTEEVLSATKALVDRGFQFREGLSDNVDLVVKMKEGLGVSAESSAELLAMYRTIGAEIQPAVDGIAQIRSETALTAQEATNYYVEISRLVNMLRPQGAQFASDNAKFIAEIAGAYKQIGGNASEIMALVKHLSSLGGIGSAAMLGAGPGFLGKEGGPQQMLERLKVYTDKMLSSAGNNEYARAAMLEAVSQQTGASQELLANLDKTIAEYKNRPIVDTGLDKAWTQQMGDLRIQLGKALSSFEGLAMMGLLPLISIAGRVVGAVGSMVAWLAKFRAIAYPLGAVVLGAVVIGTVKLGIGLWALKKSITDVVRSITFSVMQLEAVAKAKSFIDPIQPGVIPGMVPEVAKSEGSILTKLLTKMQTAKDLKWADMTRGIRTGMTAITTGIRSLFTALVPLAVIATATAAAAWFLQKSHDDMEKVKKDAADLRSRDLKERSDRATLSHQLLLRDVGTNGRLDTDAMRLDILRQANLTANKSGFSGLSDDQKIKFANAQSKGLLDKELTDARKEYALFKLYHGGDRMTSADKKQAEALLAQIKELTDNNAEQQKIAQAILDANNAHILVTKQANDKKTEDQDMGAFMGKPYGGMPIRGGAYE